jgi:hypothetical protein
VTASASATVLLPADLGDLTRGAAAIVRGRVVSAEGRWTDDHRAIETIVTLDADNYLKGSLGGTIRFRVPGGQVGRLRSLFVGAPQFAPGDRVVVFLNARGPAIPHVLGLSQGVFRLSAVEGGGWTVSPPPVLPASTARTLVRGASDRRPMALDDFERQVRQLVETGRGDR